MLSASERQTCSPGFMEKLHVDFQYCVFLESQPLDHQGRSIFFFFSFLFGSIQQNAKLPHPGIKPMAPVVKAWNCIIWHFAKAHPNVISVTHQSHLCYPLYFLHFRSILLIFFSSLHFSPPSIFSTSSSPV